MGALAGIVTARARSLGGVEVRRVLPAAHRRAVGPFVFLDHLGPFQAPPGRGLEVPPHPHVGLATVTYLLEGEIVHRDSLGTVQVIRPGEVNLMVAGRGVVHSERSPDGARARGARVHGLQLWTALPLAHEDDPPSFAHWDRAALPRAELAPGAEATVVLGAAFGAASPAKAPGDPLLVDVELAPGAVLALPEVGDLAAYVVEGTLVGDDGEVGAGELALRAPGSRLAVEARVSTRVVILGGPPLDGPPRRIEWNFVASDEERIRRAKDAWRARAFPRVPGDDEAVPLPDERR